MPVSVDFERGYAKDPDGVEANVRRLIEVGAAGLNIEDSYGSGPGEVYSLDDQVARLKAVRLAAENGGVPLSINARVDVLRRGGTFEEAIERANAYLEAGGDSAFVLGLDTEALVEQAVDADRRPGRDDREVRVDPDRTSRRARHRPHQRRPRLGQVLARRPRRSSPRPSTPEASTRPS